MRTERFITLLLSKSFDYFETPAFCRLGIQCQLTFARK
jgi:hypothetical protein